MPVAISRSLLTRGWSDFVNVATDPAAARTITAHSSAGDVSVAARR